MMAGTGTVEPFASNWAYLKVELNWLERLLMVSAARQRKETRDVNRVARSAVDRATSHWWQGLIEHARRYETLAIAHAGRGSDLGFTGPSPA